MSIPTKGETYAKLIERLRYAQEDSAMLAHLTRDDDKLTARGWLAVSELIKRLQHQIGQLATKGLH